MRDIKFRAWDTIHNNMSNSFTLIDCINDIQVFMLPENFKFMQYTGLLDKNGREIYEGDILNIGGRKEVVAWVEAQTGYEPFCFQIPSAADSYSEWTFNDYGEVIGNIHENPELLKPKGSDE